MRERLRDYSDLTTVVQGLIALSGAGFLAVIFQALAQAFWGLSVFERVLMGVCVFLVLLAIFLSRVKIFRDRRASKKSESERLSAELEHSEQERGQLEVRLREVEQKHDDLTTENKELVAGTRSPSLTQESGVISRAEYASGPENIPPPQSLPVDALSRPSLSDIFFRFTDLVRGDYIRGKNFLNCVIHGPALILGKGGEQFSCTFLGHAESVLWEVSPGIPKTGIILVEDCTFTRCTFVRIGMVGTPQEIQRIKAAFEKSSDEEPTNP